MIQSSEMELSPVLPEQLGVAWPSPAIKEAYAKAHEEFAFRYIGLRKRGLAVTTARTRAFAHLCKECCRPTRASAHWAQEFASANLPTRIQSVASVLAILTHAKPASLSHLHATNGRRPHSRYGTYPNSPALCQAVACSVVDGLFEQPNIYKAVTLAAEGRLTDEAPLRILELSCEGGQLVAAVTLEILRRTGISTNTVSAAAGRVLSLLADHCLWAFDINPLAVIATQCTFNLITQSLSGRSLRIRHLLVQDSLLVSSTRLGQFDAILNNPPWGEKLSVGKRALIRARFATTCFRPDTYIAFAELGISLLRAGGVFGLIVPSHFLASHNAAGLREYLGRYAALERIVVLPRGEFAEATVRAAILVGKRAPSHDNCRCEITIFPFRYHLTHPGPSRSRIVAYNRLILQGRRSWWPLLAADQTKRILTRVTRLRDVARLTSGIKISELESGGTTKHDPENSSQFRGARGRDFRSMTPLLPAGVPNFHGTSRRVIRHHSIGDEPRVFVRELVRRDGQMCATIAPPGVLPLHGVLTLVCHNISPAVAAALLNSTIIAGVNRRHLGGFSKVDFQRITLAELGDIPVAIMLCNKTAVAKRVHTLAHRALATDSAKKRAAHLRQLNTLIQSVYLKAS